MKWSPIRPPRLFALVSLLLIVATLAATSFTHSRFFREAVIQREAAIVRDIVHSLALRELAVQDLSDYGKAEAQAHFESTFSVLRELSGVVRIKVFNQDRVIVWSDAPPLIGHSQRHGPNLTAALQGQTQAVMNPADRPSHAYDDLPAKELIEFYVPFSASGATTGTLDGVLAIYRGAEGLNFTIRRSLILLWLVSGAGGLILFVALFGLFRSVYRRQRKAESEFARLSTEHERIVQMEKLSAMGQLVGEVAHQFNNPLVGVINLAQRAERQPDNPQRTRELLGEIRSAGEHCRDFVQRMLQFTQLARSEPQPVDLCAVVYETVAFFEQTVAERPTVEFNPGPGAAPIEADPVLLRHALYNLIHNAAQADVHGPVMLSVESASREGQAGWTVRVRDHGPGLNPQVAEKLFTPFFSTRPGGTGLGLSVAQHIAVQHGGSLWAEDNPGGGACFVLWLPKREETDDR